MKQTTIWPDVTLISTEHAPATQEIRTNSGANTLSVALLPVERASWRVDDGPTLTNRIFPGTTSIRAARDIVWAGWAQTCKCIHVGLAPTLMARVALEAGLGVPKLDYVEGIHDPLVLQCALALAEEATVEGRTGEVYAQSVATLLAAHTLRRYAGVVVKIEKGGSPLVGLRLDRVKGYIEANLSQLLSLEQIAASAALSSSHFSRVFKGATGLTPHRYVTQRRIYFAKTLLKSTALPISEVARRVGIPNQSHFTFHFRNLVGCTPRQFRTSF
jgi:AraC family transcriptional regulator